jgi:V8-like Glu-specific endopeptidase
VILGCSRSAWRAVGVVLMLLLAACSASGRTDDPGPTAHPVLLLKGRPGGRAAFWTASRLDGAVPVGPRPTQRRPGLTIASTRVGALFYHDVNGGHFCTASVVDSPHRDLLVTAAHCIHGGRGSGYRSDIVFVPDYERGHTPLGVWTPKLLLVGSRWADNSDPDMDIGFIVLQPNAGKNIADVLGANRLAVNRGFTEKVQVTGYPADSRLPVTCVNTTSRQSATQLRFACQGYPDGTSGSPWLTGFDRRTRTGAIVGVIGGYQQGGNSADVSYSPYFGDAVGQLYQQAVAQS